MGNKDFGDWVAELREKLQESDLVSHAHPYRLQAMFNQGWNTELALMDMIGDGTVKEKGEC